MPTAGLEAPGGIEDIRTKQDLARFVKSIMQADAGVLDPNVVNGLPSYLAAQLNKALTSGHIFVGNGGGVAADVAMGGVIAIDNAGVTSFAAGNKNFGFVTALPGSPTTGDRCIYTDSLTVPTYRWLLVYNGSDTNANKWQVLGGSPLAADAAGTVTTASTTYATPTGGQNTITLPLAGDYDVWGAFQSSNTGANLSTLSYAIGATVASDNWAGNNFQGSQQSNPLVPARQLGRSASDLIAEKVKTGAGTASFFRRSLRAMPVRVG